MNTHAILQSAATFNAALKFAEVAARHAHIVQVARKEAADPQLVLPLGGEEVLP
jgi:hypothetical protein